MNAQQDDYGVCDYCLWNGKLRADGTMRKHRPPASGTAGRTRYDKAQDKSQPVCPGSHQEPIVFDCEAAAR